MHPEEAIRRLRAPDQRHMGRAADPDTGQITADRLADVESVADTVRAWNPQIVPGLLQTTRYAAGAIRMGCPALSSEEVQRRAYQRAERIAAFRHRWSDGGPARGTAWFVVGETAIAEPIIDGQAHADQLAHLLNLSENCGRIVIQVLPDATPTPGRAGQFAVYGLENDAPADPNTGMRRPGVRVGYLETLVGGWYTTRVEDIARLYSAFSDMIGAALSPTDSRAYIAEVAACWEATREPHSSRPPTATRGTA